jgi:hypothetical protein
MWIDQSDAVYSKTEYVAVQDGYVYAVLRSYRNHLVHADLLSVFTYLPRGI